MVTTTLNATSIVLGSSVYDNATVTGSAGVPTGFVTFWNNATGSWVQFANVTLINGVAPFANFTPLYAGTFFFVADYSGDSNYLASGSALEILTVTPAPSTTHTYLNSTSIVLGSAVFDTANVTFPVSIPPYPVPTGTVTFSVRLTNGTWVPLGTASLVWNAGTQQLYAVSSNFTPTQTGTYYFNATYSGDGNYTGSNEPFNVDNTHEKVLVTPATPLVQTILNATTITLGQAVVTDQAIVWGLPSPPYPVPTGNVTFWYNGNNEGWVYFDNETLVNGVATSVPFTPPFAGIFYFEAIYTGDGNYTTANSGALSEQLVVQLPIPTITTTLSCNPVVIDGWVYDNATISGYDSLSLAGGQIQFWVGDPYGDWYQLGSSQLVNATGGTYTSMQIQLYATGTWYFYAYYTGNNNYQSGSSPYEYLCVLQATPCVSTNLSTTNITLGTSVYDNVTVTGYPQVGVPTGTVTFQYNITGSWVTYDTETLVNGMATSIPFTPTQTGVYYFRAEYSGDCNYLSGTSGPQEEFLIVNPNTATIVTTALNATTTTLGTSVYDTATVVPPFNSTVPTGTVQFYWELSGGSWAAYGSPVNISSGVAQSPTFTPNATGTYYFMAGYSGDGSHNSANSTMAEILTVTRAIPSVQTLINGTSAQQTIVLGQTAYDQVSVLGLPIPQYPTPTGTVQFYWKLDGGSWAALGKSVTLSSGSAMSTTFQPNATGTYYFLVVYSGDSNYVAQNFSSYQETLTVTTFTPGVQTWLNASSITIGQAVSDQATVLGLPNPPYTIPTGTITFQYNINGTWVTYDTETLVNGWATSASFTPTQIGTYYFRAVYGGDANYASAASVSNAESLIVNSNVYPALALVLRSNDSYISYDIFNTISQVWGAWFTLPSGQTPASPAAAKVGNTLYFVVKDTTGGLWYSNLNLTSSVFSGWTWMSGGTPSDLTLTSNGTDLALVVRSSDNFIFYNFFSIATQTWNGWFSLPFGGTPDTPAAAFAGSTLYFVVQDTNGGLWYSSLSGNSVFSGWTWMSGNTPSRLELCEG
jgi:hypothetical protein